MSKREKKAKEKRDAAKTDRQLDSNRVNCPKCGTSVPRAGLSVHMAHVHEGE